MRSRTVTIDGIAFEFSQEEERVRVTVRDVPTLEDGLTQTVIIEMTKAQAATLGSVFQIFGGA